MSRSTAVCLSASVVLALLSPWAQASVRLYNDYPKDVDSTARYVIYLHGMIVEGKESRPTHPEFGIYDFPKISEELHRGEKFNLIAHHREKNADFDSYVSKVEGWIRELVDAGVPPSRITLVGFSRGAYLAAAIDERLSDFHINTALLAACIDGKISGNAAPKLSGNILSIYELSDVAGSCKATIDEKAGVNSFREVEIHTGRKHGAFYTPLSVWLEPLKAWIRDTNR